MSLSTTLNASQSLSPSLQKNSHKQDPNFFARIDGLSAELKEVADRLHDLQEEAAVLSPKLRASGRRKPM